MASNELRCARHAAAVRTLPVSAPRPKKVWQRPTGPDRRLAVTVGVILLCTAAPSATLQARIVELTLKDSVRMTLRNHPDLDIARAELGVATAGISVELGVFDPQLKLGVAYQGSHGPLDTLGTVQTSYDDKLTLDAGISGKLRLGTLYRLSLGVERIGTTFPMQTFDPAYQTFIEGNVSQPLLYGAWRRSNEALLIRARHRSVAERKRLTQIAADLIRDAASRYWALVNAEQQVIIVRELLDSARAQEKLTEKLYRGGRVAKHELAQARAAIGRRREEVELRRSDLLKAEDALLRVLYPDLQRDLDADYHPAEIPSKILPPPDLGIAVKTASKHRIELAEARAGLAQAQALVAKCENALWPHLDLTGQVRLFGLAGERNDAWNDTLPWAVDSRFTGGILKSAGEMFRGKVAFNAGVTFSMPLGNNVAKGELEQARREVAKARAKLAKTRAMVALDARLAVKRLRVCAERLKAAELATTLAEENLAAEKKKFLGGISSNFDVLLRQEELARARSRAIEARISLIVARVEYKRAVGTLLDEFGAKVVFNSADSRVR